MRRDKICCVPRTLNDWMTWIEDFESGRASLERWCARLERGYSGCVRARAPNWLVVPCGTLYLGDEKRRKRSSRHHFGGGQILSGLAWRLDLRKLDEKSEEPRVSGFLGPSSFYMENIIKPIIYDHIPAFLEVVSIWGEAGNNLGYVMRKGWWTRWTPVYQYSPDWKVMW